MNDSIDEMVPVNEVPAEYKPRSRRQEQSQLAVFRQGIKNLAFEIKTEKNSQKKLELQALIEKALTGEFKSQVHEVVSIALRYSEYLDPEFVEMITKTRDQVAETLASRRKARQ